MFLVSWIELLEGAEAVHFSRTYNSVILEAGHTFLGTNRRKASALLYSRHSHLEQDQDCQKCVLFLPDSLRRGP